MAPQPFPGPITIAPAADVAACALRGERAETLSAFRSRLRQDLAAEVELADPIVVRLAIAHILPEVVSTDPLLGAMTKRGGPSWLSVVDAAYEAVGALRERGDALSTIAADTDEIATRAALLERLVIALDDELARVGLVDWRREAEIVADRVARADTEAVVRAVGAREVRARGIVSWSPPDLALVRLVDAALSRVGGRASIELPMFERAFDAGRARDPLDKIIDAVAAALDDAPMTCAIAPVLGDLRLEAGTHSPASASVEIVRAADVDTQARAIADAVYSALAGGASPSHVTIGWVSRDELAVRTTVRVLRENGIGVTDVRQGRSSRSNRVALAFSALDVVVGPPLRLAVARVLRSSYVELAGDETSRERVSLARALEETATVNAREGRGTLEATTLASATASQDRRARLAVMARRLDNLCAMVSRATTRWEHARAARNLLAGLGLLSQGAAFPGDKLGAEGRLTDPATADLEARGHDAMDGSRFIDTLDAHELATARLGYEHSRVARETFVHELSWAFERHIAAPPSALGTVRIQRLVDLGTEPSALLVVADADAAAWTDQRQRSWLVPADLEERLADAGDPAYRQLRECASGEALARLALAAATSDRVVFSLRAWDRDGAPLAASPVVEWLGAGGARTTVWSPRAAPLSPLSSRDWVLAELLSAPERAASIAPADVVRRATIERRREEAFGVRLPEGHPLVPTLPRGGLFAAVLTEETGGGDRPLSASGVDRLASCVFRGFVAEVVRPRRREAVSDLADARDAGLLVHAALAAAFRATSTLWSVRPRDKHAIVRDGLAAAEGVLAGARRGSALAAFVADQARAGVAAVLEWSLADEAWDFAFAEQSLGEEGGWSEVTLGHGDQCVRIRGRVDRVDVAHGAPGLRIIDYKRNAGTAEDHAAAFANTKFQLAIYGRAATAATGLPALQGIYLPTQRLRPGASPRVSDGRWSDAHAKVGVVDRFEKSVMDLVVAVREGRVEVRPHSPASCAVCDFSGVCRKPRFAPAALPDDVEASEVDS